MLNNGHNKWSRVAKPLLEGRNTNNQCIPKNVYTRAGYENTGIQWEEFSHALRGGCTNTLHVYL